jgi:tellurite resistance protein
MVLPIAAILLLTFVMTLIIFPQLAEFCKFPALLQNFMRTKVPARKPDPGILNCRVKISKQKEENPPTDFFNVELYGTIPVQQEKFYAILQITISDITHRFRNPKPVHSAVKQHRQKNSLIFCYRADLGWISKAESTLFDWIPIAQLSRNHLTFPYTGNRLLQLKISILSRDKTREVTSAVWSFDYENTSFGYVNLEQNIKNTKTLAVALAFAVSSADGEICDCELEIIKDWAKRNIEITDIPEKASLELNKALQKTIRFFQKGNRVDAYKICGQIVKTVPAAERYVILELCLNVAKASGVISSEEIYFLKKLAGWLQVDMERFRSMAEKIIPASMHQTQDNEVVLGITEEMTKEQARQHLNKEYRKWNARVTNTDPEIQCQADHMLDLIAQTRSQYT